MTLAMLSAPAPQAKVIPQFTVITPIRAFTTAGADAILKREEFTGANDHLLQYLDKFGPSSEQRESIKEWLNVAHPGEIKTLTKGYVSIVIVCNRNNSP